MMISGAMSLALTSRPSGGGAAPGIVTSAVALGDISIAITAPSAMSVPMQTNGSTLKLVTSGTASHTALDLTKITLTVSDLGHATDGSQTSRTRTIGVRAKLLGPYNEASVYQPNLGEFYLKLDDFLFNQDATWKTTITSINLAAGWLTSATAETVTSVTRSDSLSYFPFPIKSPTPAWTRVASGGTLAFEVGAIHDYPLSMSMIACVEAWAVDSAATAGTVVRTSTFARSPSTPNDATTVGYPVPTYALNVSPAGLLAGRCEVRWTAKPWIGPPVNSATYGDAYPTTNTAVGVPFGYDTDGSHAPLYGLLLYDPAATPTGWVRTIAASVNVTTVDVSGLCATQAGAEASGVYYADLATLATAVRRVNKNAGPFTILSDNGLSTKSYSRTTLHDTTSGGVAVCLPVSGSVLGAHLGAYSNRVATSSQVNYPPGITLFEIRSSSGLPSADVRWRGVNSDGTATTSKSHLSRMRLRGLTLDGTGVAAAADNTVFDGGATNGAPAAAVTETAAVYVSRVDCTVRNATNIAPGASTCQRQSGWLWDTRCAVYDSSGVGDFAQGSATFAGLAASIGSTYSRSASLGILSVEIPGCLLGVKFLNVVLINPSLGAKPKVKGAIAYNVELYETIATLTTSPWDANGNSYGITGGQGLCNVLARMDSATTTKPAMVLLGDNGRTEADNLIAYHITCAAKNGATSDVGRFNHGYQEQGWIRLNKRFKISYVACRSYNLKGADMTAPETASADGDGAWVSTSAYHKGNIVTSGGIGYQALVDVAANSGILLTDTATWYNGGTATVAYGPQPLRQGNGDLRYHVHCLGNVASQTANTGSGTAPDPDSWYGIAWGADEAYGQTWANYFTDMAADNYTAKAGGPLKNRVAAGKAVTPFDLVGTALLNDGTDAAGALQ